jgi:hypothetical protein
MSKYPRPWLDCGSKGTFQSYPSRINKVYSILKKKGKKGFIRFSQPAFLLEFLERGRPLFPQSNFKNKRTFQSYSCSLKLDSSRSSYGLVELSWQRIFFLQFSFQGASENGASVYSIPLMKRNVKLQPELCNRPCINRVSDALGRRRRKREGGKRKEREREEIMS